jgi:type IV secretory pathway TrbD component
METLATVVSMASGFALMRHRGTPVEILATSLLVDAALAPLTATIAARRGRSVLLWVPLGFALGMWALGAALLLPPARGSAGPRPTAPPPSSDAA